jgi:hypothetical protein
MAVTITKKPPIVALCDNVMLFEITTDLVDQENFYLLVQPWLTDGSFITGTDKLFPPTPGSAQTNLSEYLRRDLQGLRQFVFPEQGNIPWNNKTGLIKEYKIRVQECVGGDVLTTTFPLENRYVMRGKIPRWIKQKFYNQYPNFYSWAAEGQFLSLSPKTLITTATQVQKLGLLITWAPAVGDKLKLRIDIVFTDGITDSFVTAQESAELTQMALIEFGVGYGLLGLATWVDNNAPGKTIYSYAVTAVLGEVAKSETRTYIVDRSVHKGNHEFIFANSVGFYDTLLAKGASELQSEFEYEIVFQQSIGLNTLSEKKTVKVSSKDSVICRSGYMSKDMADYMAELFESTEIYENMGSYLMPLVMKNTKILRNKDSENLYVAEFEYEYAQNEKIELGA